MKKIWRIIAYVLIVASLLGMIASLGYLVNRKTKAESRVLFGGNYEFHDELTATKNLTVTLGNFYIHPDHQTAYRSIRLTCKDGKVTLRFGNEDFSMETLVYDSESGGWLIDSKIISVDSCSTPKEFYEWFTGNTTAKGILNAGDNTETGWGPLIPVH